MDYNQRCGQSYGRSMDLRGKIKSLECSIYTRAIYLDDCRRKNIVKIVEIRKTEKLNQETKYIQSKGAISNINRGITIDDNAIHKNPIIMDL